MPTIKDTSTTSLYGWAKLIVGGLGLVSGIVYAVITHDLKGGAALAGTIGTVAGLGSGAGLVFAKDDKNK